MGIRQKSIDQKKLKQKKNTLKEIKFLRLN